MAVKLTRPADATDQRVFLTSPYHPAILLKLRALGGKWQAANKRWAFDARDKEAVRSAALEVFGECGSAPIQRMDVRVPVPTDEQRYAFGETSVYMLGREVAYRGQRDMAVRLGEGVIVYEGGFYASGGSRNNPCVGTPQDGTILELRDVPCRFAASLPAGASIVRVHPAPEGAEEVLPSGDPFGTDSNAGRDCSPEEEAELALDARREYAMA